VLKEDDDTKKASFFFTAYTKDGVDDPATRPIVFAFNGGPGSSSVWLYLGLLGPRRVELDDKGNGITTPGRLVVNEHTLLTHADLVFIDPISTGFTRAIDKDEERSYHHFEKDIETVGDFIRRYLTRYERWASPKLLAGTDYLVALQQGSRIDDAAFDTVAKRLARYTGLPETFVRRSDLRIEKFHFMKELLRDRGVTVGRLDSRYLGVDRYDVGSMLEHDPSLDVWIGPYSAMLNDYVRRELGYESDLVYEILNPKVWPWNYENFQNAYADVSETLRDTMSRNPHLRVYIASGRFDLATPYFATEHTLAHLGIEEALRDNIEVSYFDAGHMMYVHAPSIRRLATEMRDFVDRATGV